MKLKLTLQRPTAAPVDVTITVDSTATTHDVARHLIEVDPAQAIQAAPDDLLTLAVAAPGADRLAPLEAGIPIGEAPIGSGFMAAVVNLGPASSQGRRRGGDAIAVMRVVEGPLLGQEFPLRAGLLTIGRSSDSDIVLLDAMVSKRHARLDVGSAIELVDLNSANGVLVDGVQVQRWQVVPGAPFVIGDSTLVVERTSPDFMAPDAVVLERGGGLLFNRSPRVEERYPGTEFKMPQLPKESFKKLFPWMMLIAPLIMAAAMYIMNGSPRSLLMMGMTPFMMFLNFVNQRKMEGNQEGHQFMLFDRQYEELEEKFFYAKPEEELARNREVPPVAEIFENSMRLGPLLWTRRPEHWNFLGLRLGTGRALARNRIFEGAEAPDGLPEFVDKVERLRERYKYVDDVPIVETFDSAGSIGVAGPRTAAADAMRGLAVQVFGLHAPNDVVAVAFTSAAWRPDLEWLKWLPHTTSENSPFKDQPLADSAPAAAGLLGALEAHVARMDRPVVPRGPHRDDWNPSRYGSDVNRAVGEGEETGPPVSVIVFVTDDAPVDRPRLVSLLERGPDAGIHAIFVGPTVESLPASCRSYVDVTEGLAAARVGLVRNGEAQEGVALEGVSNDYMQMFARHLAPVVDASVVVHDSSDIPNSVSFLSLTGKEVADDPEALVERWRQNNTIVDRSNTPRPRLKKAGNLRAIVGQGASDAMTLDLRTQGPHALVGGTTGAGKSEFLQAWVLGMAAAHSPDRVTFLFVDYKGGSAFADCVELPHCVGLVTDLSPHLVRRALTSLRAELHHREHLFNRKKVKDLLELEKRQDPETPPALVLVIDEFAALAGEVPEFVDGVVDIAQRGRSLGIHLIMATQRPAGVIKDNLRANTNLRVALRMADENDSEDVVGDPVAARFPASIPGRAIAKTGHSSLIPFQSAYAGGWTSDDETPAEIAVAELRFGSAPVWESPNFEESDFHDEDLGPSDLRRIVDNLIAASAAAAIRPPRKPWLEDLPSIVDLSDLTNDGDASIPFAMVDVPERQAQETVTFDPDRDGSMVVFGTSGSGKSTLLRTLATAAGMRPEVGAANVYCLDFASGGLSVLSRLPHVGSIVDGEDTERITRLLLTLDGELDRRASAFAAVNAGDLMQYRKLADPSMPRILVLVDNFGEFKKDWEYAAARQPAYRAFIRLVAEGRQLGVHTVLTADRANAIPTTIAANIQRRVILRLSDESQYMMIGAPKDILDDQSPAGRAILGRHEGQIAVLGGSANTAEQAKALDALAESLRAAGVEQLPEIGALPTKAPVSSLPAMVDGLPVFGIADETLAPMGFEPQGSFVITGPPASGKTNMLKALIIAMERFDPAVQLYHFGSRRSELKEFRPWVKSASREEEAKDLATELAELMADESQTKRIMIVVEDVPHLADSAAERAVRLMFKALRDSDHMLVGDADVSRATAGVGVMGDWKQSRQGIVLKPDTYDGDTIFKTAFGKVKRGDSPVGRGFFVQAGRAHMVQTPYVD